MECWKSQVKNLDDITANIMCFFMFAICSFHQLGDMIKVISILGQLLGRMLTCSTYFSWWKWYSMSHCALKHWHKSCERDSQPCFTAPHVKHPLLLLTAHRAQLSAALRLIYGSTPHTATLFPSARWCNNRGGLLLPSYRGKVEITLSQGLAVSVTKALRTVPVFQLCDSPHN